MQGEGGGFQCSSDILRESKLATQNTYQVHLINLIYRIKLEFTRSCLILPITVLYFQTLTLQPSVRDGVIVYDDSPLVQVSIYLLSLHLSNRMSVYLSIIDSGHVKETKLRVSSYFHSSFSPTSSPCGANCLTLRNNHLT